MKKYILGIIIGLVIIVAIIAAVLLNNNSTDDENIELTTIQLNEVTRSVFYAPQYVAINNGYFEETDRGTRY